MGYACGEGPDNCGADCGTSCGNGTCDKGEAPDSCPDDCARFVCGNGVCEPGDGGPEGCPADCGIACGNCKCEGGEDFVACPIDCGYCGDGICSPCAQLGEETGKCVADCGGAVAEPAPDAGGGTSDEGSPSEPVLVVDLRYDGTRPIGTVEVFLYGQQAQSMVRCANLVPGFLPPAAHTMSVVRTEPPIAHTVTFTNFPGLETNSPQDYTLVAVGYEGQDAQTGPPVAWDCIDGTGERKVSVSFGQSTTVSMVLADLRRLLCPSGSSQCHYELDSFFDMPSLVPDSAEAPVNTVLDFFDEPPASLLSMICTFDNTALEDLCGLMSSDPNAPCTDQSAGCFTALGTIAFDLLDSSVAGLIEDNLPGAFGLGRDVRNVLEQLDLQATLTFKSEPDAEGFIAQDKTLMEWHTLRYRWTYGALEGGASCPVDDNDCGWRSYNLKSLLGLDNVLTSQFSGRLDGEPALSVEPFPLDLKYAALINSVLEKFVLPLLTGDPNTTTYEAFIGSLAGGQGCMLSDDFSRCCENFGEAVSDNSLHQDVIRVGCNALVGLAGEFLRTQLVGLSVGTGAALTLSTQAPCRMFDNDANAVFDQLGLQVSKPQDKRCIWHVELAPGVEGEARFFGCRGVPCSH